MARPVSIRDETIIAAAREVFLERGVRATTAEVAARAGVSEGSIFKRFKTKGELFSAAMGDRLREPPCLVNLVSRVGRATIEESLFDLGMELITFFRELIPLTMMTWSNPGLPSAISGPNPPPVRGLKQLAGFFEAEMERGRLRRFDAEILARTFLGGMHHFAFFELLHLADGQLPLGAESYVRGLVTLMMQGVAPVTHAASSQTILRRGEAPRARETRPDPDESTKIKSRPRAAPSTQRR
jgi:AcrR family transcriptional regulator